MVKSLLLLSALLGVNSMSVASNSNDQYYGVQERQYQHTEDVGNTDVTYKYETNEVSSVADLVVGNIYHFDSGETSLNGLICDCSFVYGVRSDVDLTFSIENSIDDMRLYLFGYDDYCSVNVSISGTWAFAYSVTYEFDFVYTSNFNANYINYVSSSSYNEITSVEYIPPTTIFGHLAEVLGDNLYGGIPNVDNVIFSIGGQDITLKSWLVTSTCIVLAVVLITILCLFIRWLFKLFSNTILLR